MPLKDTITQLNTRVEKLEKRATSLPSSFSNKMENILKKKEEEEEKEKETQIDSIKTLYEEGIKKNKLTMDVSNLPKIVEYSVQFVEDFFKLTMQILGVIFENKRERGRFKKEMCVNLISEYIQDFDINLLSNLIEEIVTLLFNRDFYEEKKDEEMNKRKKKNSGSLRKVKKILNPF